MDENEVNIIVISKSRAYVNTSIYSLNLIISQMLAGVWNVTDLIKGMFT